MEQQNPDYEAAFARLEEIAVQLEQGTLPLEASLALFEEGSRLAVQLNAALEQAEQRLCILRPDGREDAADA
ncbi:MAG: exodeoxyribonuclease VII small subunit [Oscillospiraceae bacterium]|jgi:exodeoxyribonuclease VII small subunit|nr:exodeoxyribonuclease VII small subunit [Oscillospiraceae bacterium]